MTPPYEDANTVWRLHHDLLRVMTPCQHGEGANRAYPQDGCDYCFSRRVIERALKIIGALAKQEVAV